MRGAITLLPQYIFMAWCFTFTNFFNYLPYKVGHKEYSNRITDDTASRPAVPAVANSNWQRWDIKNKL
jgi:hypothetical protein